MITMRIELACDEDHCRHALVWTATNQTAPTVAAMTAAARHRGWAISRFAARCPDHRRRAVDVHPFVPEPTGGELCGAKIHGHYCWKRRDHAVHEKGTES